MSIEWDEDRCREIALSVGGDSHAWRHACIAAAWHVVPFTGYEDEVAKMLRRASEAAIHGSRVPDRMVARLERMREEKVGGYSGPALRAVIHAVAERMESAIVQMCFHSVLHAFSDEAGIREENRAAARCTALAHLSTVAMCVGKRHAPFAASERARAMAEEAYRREEFDALPVLADMLEDEGCGDREMLVHLRWPFAHHRGCGALDAVGGSNRGSDEK